MVRQAWSGWGWAQLRRSNGRVGSGRDTDLAGVVGVDLDPRPRRVRVLVSGARDTRVPREGRRNRMTRARCRETRV